MSTPQISATPTIPSPIASHIPSPIAPTSHPTTQPSTHYPSITRTASTARTASAFSRPFIALGQIGRSLLASIWNIGLFLKHFYDAPSKVGAICPSSGNLARAIVAKALPKTAESPARSILEVGPGTGAITKEIIKRLGANDHLDLVEQNLDFAQVLTSLYQTDRRITIHAADFIEWSREQQAKPSFTPYHVVISGLPLNIFSAQQVRACLDGLKQVTHSNGSVTYFEYPRLMSIKKIFFKIFGPKDSYERACSIEQAKEAFCPKEDRITHPVYFNIPPARVVHCNIKKS